MFSYVATCSGIPSGNDRHAGGRYSCDRGTSIASRCTYFCGVGSYNANPDAYKECHAVFYMESGTVADAEWYGIDGYCTRKFRKSIT